jgi:hypothetical protein
MGAIDEDPASPVTTLPFLLAFKCRGEVEVPFMFEEVEVAAITAKAIAALVSAIATALAETAEA